MQAEYEKTIDEIMTEKLKHPHCLIDAEALASHVSIVSSAADVSGAKGGQGRSGAGSSSKSGKGGSSTNKGMKSSQSNLKESMNQSQTSDQLSGTSMSQTATNAISSEVVGDYGKVKNVEYIQVQLPDSMLRAIRIIERLLT